MQIDRIVVGLTPGHECDAAVRRAMRLGRAFDARVHAVHGVGVGSMRRGVGDAKRWAEHVTQSQDHARKACSGKLSLLVEDSDYAETPVDEYLFVRPEKGADALLAHAREHGSELVVLGEHRREGLFDFGSTARAVLGGTTCPVWVQPSGPEPDQDRDVERVLAAIDLGEGSAPVVRAGLELAARFSVPLEILHVFVPPTFAYDVETGVAAGPSFVVDDVRRAEREELERLVAALPSSDVEVTATQVEGEAVEAVRERADARTLVVLGTHGHSGLARALLGSVAHGVLKSREGPTLVIPTHAD